jgi:hypothetical protein
VRAQTVWQARTPSWDRQVRPGQHTWVEHGWLRPAQQTFTVLFTPKLFGVGHPLLHAAPGGQHVRFEPLPHGVVPGGHPQNPVAWFWQATPLAQHAGPQGVWPGSQQQPVCGHVVPGQQV